MAYTVKALAKISGVSDRTLRYYDEINLLKPAYVGENQYRYYENEQLMRLQQILFFRELNFPLEKIQHILSSNDFDKVDALVNHKQVLTKKIKTLHQLLNTIDNTVSHLRGKILMHDKDLYKGFNVEKQKEHEDYLVKRGLSRDEIDNSWRKISKLSRTAKEKLHDQCESITKALARAIYEGASEDSPEVQELIKAHYQWVCNYWQPNQESYIGLSKLYLEHNDFNEFYNKHHPKMASFLSEAMVIFATQNLE
tara:strand:- start:1419 stop:2177 length:759 start_codon:yes stop_codon:yes gene_type:complete